MDKVDCWMASIIVSHLNSQSLAWLLQERTRNADELCLPVVLWFEGVRELFSCWESKAKHFFFQKILWLCNVLAEKYPRKSTFWHFYSVGFVFVNSGALGMLWDRSLFFHMALEDKKICLDFGVLINDTNPWHKNKKSPKHFKDMGSVRFSVPS